MTNKVVRDKSRSAECLSDKARFLKQKPNKKVVNNIIKQTCLLQTYCLKCKKNTKNKDAKMIKTKNCRLALSSKCVVCGHKKSRFMKEQEANGLFSNLEIKTPLSTIPLLNILF